MRELSDHEKNVYVAWAFSVIFVMLLVVASVAYGRRGWSTIAFAGAGVAIIAGLLLVVFVLPQELSVNGASRIYMGGPVNSREGLSQVEAELQRGNSSRAIELLDQRIAEVPTDISLRLFAANLYATLGQTARSVTAFRELQRTPNLDDATDIVVSNRLADLFLGAADDAGHALVELRRIVVRHPGTRAAASAHDALSKLKSTSADS